MFLVKLTTPNVFSNYFVTDYNSFFDPRKERAFSNSINIYNLFIEKYLVK